VDQIFTVDPDANFPVLLKTEVDAVTAATLAVAAENQTESSEVKVTSAAGVEVGTMVKYSSKPVLVSVAAAVVAAVAIV